jgi:hypothetical protein
MDRRTSIIVTGSVTALVVVVVVVTIVLLTHHAGSGDPAMDETGAAVLRQTIITDSAPACTHTSCPHGAWWCHGCSGDDQCIDGVCTRPCSQCVPDAFVELGDPNCLDFWERHDKEMVHHTAVRNVADTARCERMHVQYDLLGPQQSRCKITTSNRCE